MKKRLLFLFAIIAAMATAMAKPVDQATAKKVATTYLQSVTGKTFSDLTDITAQSPFHEYYVFTLGNGGFILVSGDDCVMPVLAYSENTPFVLENMPDHIMEWMQMYDNQIAFYRSRVGRLDYGGSQVVENQWRSLSEGTILRSQYPSAVSPLLSTTWNQSPYYNQLCPQTVDGTKCVTGCAATACAQIMKYWNHPSTGYGSHTYYHTTFDSLSANFGTTTYNWSNMPNALNASSTTAQVQAVATLMYHVGVSINMKYGTSAQGGSAGATSSWGSATKASVENSLVQYFKYKQSCHTIYHDEFSDDEWGSMLRAELDASRPILYTGFDVDAGHAFVFDGYNNQGQFHVNWGWGSYCDGYYTVGQLNPSTGGTGGNTSGTYNLDSYALIGIEPNTNWSSSASTTVSLSVSNSSAGSVYGSGTYPFGSTIYMSATANDVNRFYKWSDGSTLVSREAIAAGGNLNLTAYVGPLSGDTLSYCFNTYYSNYGWGDQSTDVYWGFKLPASTLAGHDPLSVVKIFVDDTGTFDLIIYTGANDPETTIYTGTYHLHNSEQWNDMILSTPLAVTGNDNLWIFVHNYGLEYPMTISSGSGNNYGSLYSAGMAPTQNYYTFGGDYAWMMKAIFGEYTGDSGEQTSGCTRYVTIGSEESNANSYYTPVNNYYNYSLSETIIDAEEIGGPLNISSLSYYYSYDSPSTSKTNCTIYLQPTTKTVFTDASDIVPLNLNTAVMVYSGSLNCSMGWNEFVFNTPFEYDGTSNLLVIVDDNSGQYNSSSYTFRVSPSNGVKTITWYSDNNNPDVTNLTTFSGNTNYIYNRALMKLAGCPPCTEAVVEIGNVESSTSENQIPFNCYYNYSLSETIIQADEIDGPMEISGISYKYASTDTPTTSKYGIKIWIKPTNKNAFASNSDVEILDASAVLVYDGTPAIAQGWNDIVFDTPFSYNGDGNIMVIVNDTVNGYDGSNYKFNTAPCSGNLTLAWYSDSYVPSPYSSTFSGNKYTYAYRPVMMLKGCNYSGEGSYCAPVTGVAVTSVGTTSVSVSFDTNSAASYDVYVYTATGSVACSTSTSTGTATLSNLNPATTYFLRVQADCGDGVYSILSEPVSFFTSPLVSDAIPLPYFCNFEGLYNNGWQFVNGNQTNFWIVDSATSFSGEKALYITNDGFSNAYTTSSAPSVVFATILVDVTEPGSYIYRYNWKAYGENSYDFLRAALVPASVELTAGDYSGFNNTTGVPTGAIALDNGALSLSDEWQTATDEITIADTGLYNIVFMWKNDNSMGYQPPAAIDNVFLGQNSCPRPQNIAVTPTATSITLTWTAGGSESSWLVTCDATSMTVNTNSCTFNNLVPNQDYFVTLQSLCNNDETSMIYETTIHTLCAPETLPFYEDFSSNLSSNLCWRGASNATAAQVFAGTELNLTTPGWNYASSLRDGLDGGHYYKNVYGSNVMSWLITPAIDLTTTTSAQLSFDVALTDYNNAALPDVNGDTNNSQAFMVIISTDGGNTWSADNATIWQNEGGDFTYASLGNTAYQNKVINLNQYLGNTIKIAFYCQSLWNDGDNDLHIDNIAVTEASSCPAPTITVTDFGNRSVSFSWSSTADSVLVGLFNHDGQQIIGQFMPATGSVADYYLPEEYFPFGYGYVAALSVCGAYADHNLSGTVFESFAITCDEEEQCTVTFLLTDIYGDGWNGGALDIYDTVSGLVVCSMTAPDLGGQDTPLTHITTYDLCPDRVYSIVYRSGQFDNEVSFTILGPDSTVYGSFSNPNAGVLGYFTHTCSAASSCEAPVITDVTYEPYNNGEGDFLAMVTWNSTGAQFYQFCWTEPEETRIISTGDDTVHYFVIHPEEESFVKIRAICGDGDTSAWSDNVLLYVSPTQGCDAVSIPFAEGFEDGVMPDCWTNDGPGNWSVGTGDYNTSTGAHSGSYNAKIDHSISGNTTKLITPVIDMSTVTNAELRFWHVQRNWAGDQDILTVYYRTSAAADWQTLATYSSNITTWTEEIIALPNLSSTYQIAFEMTDSYGYGVAIDDITIDLPPACSSVSNLTASDITNNSITLEWNDINNTGATYSVYAVSATGDALISNNISGTSYIVTNLTAHTNYTFGVVANCSEDLSSTMATIAVTTLQDPILCGSDEALVFANADSVTSTTSYFPGYSYYNYSYSEVIIPVIRLLGLGEIKGMEYYVNSIAAGSSYFNNCEIYLMNTTATSLSNGFIQDNANMQLVYSGDLNQTETGWKQVTFDTSFMYDGVSNLLVAVRRNHGTYASTGSFGAYTADAQLARYVYRDDSAYEIGSITDGYATDNVPVYHMIGCAGNAPNCMPVSNLTVSDVSAHTVTLNWVDNNNTGATYTVYNMADNSVVATGISGTTYTVTGLAATTGYTFGVVANCSATDASIVIAVNATTDCANGRCNIYVYAQDSYGDGWNGNTINFTQGGIVMDSYTMPNQGLLNSFSYDTAAISICAGSAIELSWVSGSFASEVSFDIVNGNNQIVFSASGSDMVAGATFFTLDSCNADAPVIIPDTVNITIAVNDATMGTITPVPGTYQYLDSDTISLTATANTGYHFVEWDVEYYINGVLTSITLTNSSPAFACSGLIDIQPITFTAVFAADTLAVDSMLVNIAVNNTSMGTTIPVPGAHYFYTGDTASVVAVPNAGYMIEGWYILVTYNGIAVIDDTIYNNIADVFDLFTEPIVVDNDYAQYVFNITAFFAPEPSCMPVTGLTVTASTTNSVTISWNGTANSYSIYNGQTFVANTTGNSYTFTGLAAATSYTFGVVAVCNTSDSSAMIIVTTNTECDIITTYPYIQDFNNGAPCWSAFDADGDGNNWVLIQGAIHSASFDNNSGVLYPDNWLITPHFLLAQGTNYEVTWNANPQDPSWPAEHYGLYVSTTDTDTDSFTLIQDWTLTSAGHVPVIDLSSYAGQSVYLAFRHWNCSDMYQIAIDNFQLREAAGSNQITVTLTQNNPMYGSVDGGGVYNIGDNVTVTATPSNGYQFSRWTDVTGSTVSTSNPYSFVAATDITLQAVFINGSADTYTITVDVNDSTMGTAMGSGSYAAGDVAVLTAYAFPGYRFVNWTQNGINLGSDNPFTMTVTNNSAAYPIIANFEVDSMPPLEEYLTLITAVNNPAWGTMTPAPGTYNLAAGETVHFSATPYEGYHFLSADISVFFMGIHMADTTVYTNLSEIDLTVAEEMLGATINVTVNFVPDSHEPAVLHVSYDPAMGHVLINGLQDSVYTGVIGETVTLEAVANDGYVFDTWSDGVTNATRTLLLVDEDYTISASFMESEGIDIAGILAGLKVYPNPTYGKVTIDADNVHRVQVMDLNGRVVTTFENTNIFDLSNLTSGVYMLRIETANGTTVRRIVKK